jgi:hypothetical protein
MGLRKQQIKTKTATNKQTKFHHLQQQQKQQHQATQHKAVEF